MSGRTRLLSLLILMSGMLLGQDLKYLRYDDDLVPTAVHAARRDSVRARIGIDAIAVFFSAPERTRNADVEYAYRQDDNFYYLTGFDEPNAVLVLIPSGWTVRNPVDTASTMTTTEILFVPARNPMMETWTGRRFGPSGVMQLLGMRYAVTNDKLKSILPELLAALRPATLLAPTIPTDANRQLANLLTPVKAAVDSQNAWQRGVRDPNSIVKSLRAVKSPEEIALITRAVEISALAHRQAMMSCEPGMYEYELQAVYEYVYTRSGAEYSAYPCIVGSAENSVVLHYESNRRKMVSGDMIVADCGAEYHHYAADITRSFPVNGKFTANQRKIYQIVLEAQKAAIKMLEPGVTMKEVSDLASDMMEEGLYKLGIISEKGKGELRRFYMHGLGHSVGLNVHDVGTNGPLEAGMVYTIEPGIYIAEGTEGVDPAFWNLGVRIEDTVLITPDGNKVLSAAAPKEIAEIEALMAKKGIGNQAINK